jgi:hypothetical protein
VDDEMMGLKFLLNTNFGHLWLVVSQVHGIRNRCHDCEEKAWSCNWNAQNCTLPYIMMPCLRIFGAKLGKDCLHCHSLDALIGMHRIHEANPLHNSMHKIDAGYGIMSIQVLFF